MTERFVATAIGELLAIKCVIVNFTLNHQVEKRQEEIETFWGLGRSKTCF